METASQSFIVSKRSFHLVSSNVHIFNNTWTTESAEFFFSTRMFSILFLGVKQDAFMYWFCNKRVAINELICFIPVSPVSGELVVDDLNVELVTDVKLSDPTKTSIHFVRFNVAFTFV